MILNFRNKNYRFFYSNSTASELGVSSRQMMELIEFYAAPWLIHVANT